MKDSTSIWMHLLSQKDLKVFVLDRGMDIFVPVFIWPTPIKSIEINQNTLLMDMRITKNIFIKNDQKCESKEDYVYTGTYVLGRWYKYVILGYCLRFKPQTVLQKSSYLYSRLCCYRVRCIL